MATKKIKSSSENKNPLLFFSDEDMEKMKESANNMEYWPSLDDQEKLFEKDILGTK